MGFSITYQRILQLHLWHHFWLDATQSDGTPITFEPPGSDNTGGTSTGRETDYDIRNYVRIKPSPRTQYLLERRGLSFHLTSSGGFVAGKTSVNLNGEGKRFTFLVRALDPAFVNYASLPDLTTIQQPVFHLTNASTPTTDRLLLTAGGNNHLRAVHFFSRQGRVVRLRISDGLGPYPTTTTVEVFDLLSSTPNVPLRWPDGNSFYEVSIQEDQREIELDVRHLSEGRYRFAATALHPDQPTVLYLGLEEQAQLLGVIDLFPANWVGSAFDIRLGINPDPL
ncbi:MAG: hypothetical protein AAF828_00855 [Bacteroidota bacterium]